MAVAPRRWGSRFPRSRSLTESRDGCSRGNGWRLCETVLSAENAAALIEAFDLDYDATGACACLDAISRTLADLFWARIDRASTRYGCRQRWPPWKEELKVKKRMVTGPDARVSRSPARV